MPDSPLTGQVALITGAAKRIGRSIALRLASEGADIVVNYENSKSDAEDVVAKITASGRRAIAIQGDVSKKRDVFDMFARVSKQFSRLDILVNNAGTFFAADFETLTEEQWDRIMNTNLRAQFLCAQAAIPLLRRSPSPQAHIVNISSLGGILAWPAFTHYCVSKAGVIHLTKCLARGLAPKILVNSVAPGTIQFPGEAPDEDYIKRTPVHRTGTGEDIADAVAFFVKSNFVTGQILAVDGGRMVAQ